MATATIKPYDRFPAGTALAAHPIENVREAAAPVGSSLAAATMNADGLSGAVFSGLPDQDSLAAYALVGGEHRYVRFTTFRPADADATTLDPESFGAVADGQVLTDVSITAGSAILTSPSGPFHEGDVGKIAVVLAAGAGSPVAGKGFTIASVDSPTQVTLSATATTTVSGGIAAFGTDSGPGILAALGALDQAQGGGRCVCRAGLYMTSSRVVIPGGVILEGAAIDYNGDDPMPGRGTVICAAGTLTTSVVQVGSVVTTTPISHASFNSGNTSAQMRDVVVFGGDIVADAISVIAPRWSIDHCQAGGGNTAQVNIAGGQNGCMQRTIVNGHSRGAGVIVAGVDNKILDNQIRGWRTYGIDVMSSGSHTEIERNSIYCNTTEDTVALANIRLNTSLYGQLIAHNIFGTVNMQAPDILINANASSRDFTIIGNIFYRTVPATASQPAIRVDTTAGAMRGLAVTGNQVHCSGSAGLGMSAIVQVTGTNAIHGWTMVGNYGSDVTHIWTAASTQVPAASVGNANRYDNGGGMTTYVNEQRGRSTQNGTGAQTVFTIPHMVGPGSSGPTMCIVTPGHADADGEFYATADSTNITVTYAVAPPTGTGNVILNWYAAKS
jgi:hypothetical protein